MKWEYFSAQIEVEGLDFVLTNLGRDGWELVSCEIIEGRWAVLCVLKRRWRGEKNKR